MSFIRQSQSIPSNTCVVHQGNRKVDRSRDPLRCQLVDLPERLGGLLVIVPLDGPEAVVVRFKMESSRSGGIPSPDSGLGLALASSGWSAA